MDDAASTTLGYTPACTLRMQTASGTLTTEPPAAAAAPATNATLPAAMSVWRASRLHAAP